MSTTPAPHPDRLPALYLSHGAPPLVDDQVWIRELTIWGQTLPRPKATLLDYRHTAPALRYAHPTVDHFVPLFVALGASLDSGADASTVIEGFWLGNSKRSIELG